MFWQEEGMEMDARSLVLAMIALSPLLLSDLSHAAGRVFYDGFETGNTNLWSQDDYHNRCQVVTAAVDGVAGPYKGSRMARCNWNGTVDGGDPVAFESLKILTNSYTNEFFIRVWIRADQNLSGTGNSSAKILRGYQTSTMDYYHEFKGGTGLFFAADINGYQPDAYWGGEVGDNTRSPLAWHKMEIYANAATGKLKVWHDGILVQDATHSFGGRRFEHFYLVSNFADGHDATNNIYFDEVEVFTDTGSGASGSMADASVSASASAPPAPPSGVSVR